MTHTNDDGAKARLVALSAKLRSQDPIPSRSEIAAEINSIREALDRREAVPVDLSHGWLIHKAGRGWYRPNAKGYTGCIAEAGRYSHEDALDYSHPNGWDGPRDNITIKHESEATTTRSDLCASGKRVRAVLEGAVNGLDALLTLVQETSCDPDDPEAFDEVVMAAGMWLSSARAEIERLDRATTESSHGE